MQCRSCGAENRPERKFCSGCGVALSRACPACGFANDAADKFCGGCGAAVGGAPKAETESDLRPATILFADLSGYTELSATLAPDDLQELLNAFFVEADAAVANTGGHIDKHIGDCVMAVFGAPVAYGDDAIRAATAALDIVARVKAMASERRITLDCHCGLATGFVAAGETGSGHHSSYTVTGQTVNLAARLCDRAKGGDILADGPTVEAIGERFVCGAGHDERLDGFVGAIGCALLLARRAEAMPAVTTPLVGRDRELRLGSALLDLSRDTRRGQVLVLRGEPGLGKSRLTDELKGEALRRGFAVRTAHVTSFGNGLEADPVRAAFKALAGIDAEPIGAATLASRLAQAAVPPHVAALAYELAGLPSGDLAQALSSLDARGREAGRRELLSRLAACVAGEAPLLFVVEDMHWAGRETIDAMAALGRSFAAQPAMLLMTVRPEGDPLDAAWRHALGATPLTMLELRPLDAANARALVGALAREGDRIDGLVERAGGNPLFLVELTHHMLSHGEELPGSIRSLVAARVDRLTGDGRGTLQPAAVLGQRFAAADLASLRDGAPVALRELFERHLLSPTDDGIAFVHALVRDAVYDMLPKSRRHKLHGLAARCFAGRDQALEAHHLDLAGDPAAPEAFWRAAETARGAQRLAMALELNGRGIAAAGGGENRMKLQAQRGEILLELGEAATAEAVWREAAEAAPSNEVRARAWIGVAQALRLQGRRDEALRASDAARQGLDAEPSPALMALLHNVRGNLLFTDYARCAEEHGLSLDWARRSGSVEAEARALGGLGDAHYSRGLFMSAAASFGACVNLAEEHGLGRIALANRPMDAWCRFLCGDLAGARAIADATVHQAEAIGAKRPEMIAQHARCAALEQAGDVAAALTALARAELLARELGAAIFVAEARSFRAALLLDGGERQKALSEAREAVSIARGSDMKFCGPWSLSLVAICTDDMAERDAALAEAQALLEQGCVSHNYVLVYSQLILFDAGRGEWDRVEGWARALDRYTAAEPFAFATIHAEAGRLLAALARSRDRESEALSALIGRAASLGFGCFAAKIEAIAAAVTRSVETAQ